MKALIVIDAQEDFTRGALRNEEAIQRLPNIAKLIEWAREHKYQIVYTQDTHYSDYLETQEGKNLPVPHCIKDSDGWQICSEVTPQLGDIAVVKYGFSYNNWEDVCLGDSIEEIMICGFCTDICISANFQLLKALYREVPITVIENCCAGVTPELHDAAIKVMKSCQANVVKLEDVVNGE